jgi:hypothetical protein
VRTEDFALLPFAGAVLYNNPCFKGDIQNARQQIFQNGKLGGWTWDWPEGNGLRVKTYPEIILGRSPWSAAKAGNQLPCLLSEAQLILEFDFTTEASGAWCESFDFWITSEADPTSKDITCNLTIWTTNHGLEPSNSYEGSREILNIGGRIYQAILETHAERHEKAWKTLCLIDTEPRCSGSLELGPLLDVMIARGLAKSTEFLATAELGCEIAFGKGHTTVRRFALSVQSG